MMLSTRINIMSYLYRAWYKPT